jgi:hypothetical protein
MTLSFDFLHGIGKGELEQWKNWHLRSDSSSCPAQRNGRGGGRDG